jgi:NAD(P)-dependent dehydrogenase (short-subunit alcohol dehydrogenase family)
LIADTSRELGQLNALINMASSYVLSPFDELTEDDLDRALEVDLRGAYLCALAAVPHLRSAGGGHIINFSDWVAHSGRPRYPGFLPYYVAKKAVIGLTEALALELAEDRILVNAIAPGAVRPPEEMAAAEIEKVSAATPLGRWGGDDEIARAVVALLGSDFTTGETIRVDGGRHLR